MAEDTRSKINNAGSSRASYKYPSDYDSYADHWLILTEYKYSRSSSQTEYKPIPTGVTIQLPVPLSLNTAYNTNWNASETGIISHLLQNYASGLAASSTDTSGHVSGRLMGQNIVNDATSKFQEIVGKVGEGDFSGAAKAAGGNLAADILTATAIDNPATQFLSRSLGLAKNPFMAVVFEGVDLRTFNFDYSLFPKSLKDAKAIQGIIKTLKFGMHPSYADTPNFLFNYPYMYKPSFTNDQYLFKMGFSVITSFQVDYHGQGMPVYFNDQGNKIPASIKIQFTMKEMEIVTKETIDKDWVTNDSSITKAVDVNNPRGN